MNVAVMTMTRDRLLYTEHCFAQLRLNAGCEYDHYVLDQGSEDGTVDWLGRQWVERSIRDMILSPENLGCCRGWNTLLGLIDLDAYDVIVCFDNDCELTQPWTLLLAAQVAEASGHIVSPHVQGLRNPPPRIGRRSVSVGGDSVQVSETAILGNIFMAIPAALLRGEGAYRWDESQPVWAGGEAVTGWHRLRGGWCGYIDSLSCTHYETTLGQVRRFPEYFERRVREGGPAL